MDSILGQAEIVSISPINTLHGNVNDKFNDNLSFGAVEDIQFLLDYFQVDTKQIDGSTVDRLRYVHDLAKNSGKDMLDFIIENGARVGGRYGENFLGKMYVYLQAIQNEEQSARRLGAAILERQSLETKNAQNSDSL